MSDVELHHVNVLVDELAAAVDFYRDVLGLEPTATPDQGFPSQFFRFNDTQQLHMNQIPDARSFRAHFCIVVPDFEGVFRRALSAGAVDLRPWGKIRRLPSGKLQMFVRDPSGNLIEVASRPDAHFELHGAETAMFDFTIGNYTVAPGTGMNGP